MKIKFIIFLILATVELFSIPKTDSALIKRMTNIENSITTKGEIYDKFNFIEKKIDNEEKLNEKTFDCISKQLDAASYNLTLFGILFGIAAICIGIYVTYVERKIVRISEENKDLLQKNVKIKAEVEDLNRLIQNDIYGLHLKIKREETIHILDRLNIVPKDIANVCTVLLSRELLPDDYAKIRSAYLKVKESCLADEGEENGYNQYTENYKLVMFQHFLNNVMKDDEIRKDFTDFIYFGIQGAFENDIIKSSTDFTVAIIDLGMHKFTTEITKYFEGLSASSHKNYLEVYKVFYETLQSRKNRFDFFGFIETKDTTRKAKVNYGQILIEKYKNDNPTEREQLIFEELKTLIDIENKAEEARRVQIENAKKAAEERKAKKEELKRQREAAAKENK